MGFPAYILSTFTVNSSSACHDLNKYTKDKNRSVPDPEISPHPMEGREKKPSLSPLLPYPFKEIPCQRFCYPCSWIIHSGNMSSVNIFSFLSEVFIAPLFFSVFINFYRRVKCFDIKLKDISTKTLGFSEGIFNNTRFPIE